LLALLLLVLIPLELPRVHERRKVVGRDKRRGLVVAAHPYGAGGGPRVQWHLGPCNPLQQQVLVVVLRLTGPTVVIVCVLGPRRRHARHVRIQHRLLLQRLKAHEAYPHHEETCRHGRQAGELSHSSGQTAHAARHVEKSRVGFFPESSISLFGFSTPFLDRI